MNKKNPEPASPETNPTNSLSRRQLLQYAGYGVALMALSAADVPADALPLSGLQNKLQGAVDSARQQLPYYSDAPWDQSQYYETIQSVRRMHPRTYQNADIDGDGRDELIARGPGGIHVNKYDPDTGQWIPMADGPGWRDGITWDQPEYYKTIHLADIDGDGRAELIGRGGGGIEVYKYIDDDPASPKWIPLVVGGPWSDGQGWNQPQYYTTIQSAVLFKPGDPGYSGKGSPQAVLFGRGLNGLEAWVLNSAGTAFGSIAEPLSSWADGLWNQPQYYQTIQCADIDKDGRAEIIGRGGLGIEIYKFDNSNPQSPKWISLIVGGKWSDGIHWANPQYYSTIQCADLLGTGGMQFVGRGGQGLEVYSFDVANKAYVTEAPFLTNWDDPAGWDQPQYYQTIQCADIDGDGKAEVIGRGVHGMEAYKLVGSDPQARTWTALPVGGLWGDDVGWNHVQHYFTIQTARVLLKGDRDYIGDGTHSQAVIMGRGALSLQTYRFVSPTQGWVQTSAPPPVFTPGQQKAYSELNKILRNRVGNEIRASYNNKGFLGTGGTFSRWQQNLYNPPPLFYDQQPRPHSSLAVPTGITQEDWDIVTWQIYWELQWVQLAYDWYGPGKLGGLIDKNTIAQMLTLQDVGGFMGLSSDSSLEILFTILALVASGAAAILTAGASVAVEGAVLGVASAVAGGLAGAFGAVPGLLPGGGGAFPEAYNALQNQIDKSFTVALLGNEKLLFGLTGGLLPGGTYFPLDYGRLKQIGGWIGDGTWQWDTGPGGGSATELLVSSARGYALYVWKTLMTAQPWIVWVEYQHDPPDDFPPEYAWFNAWLSTSTIFSRHYPPTSSMEALYKSPDPSQEEQTTFPLGVPLYDVYKGIHGWPPTSLSDGVSEREPVRSSLGVDLGLSAELSRDPYTGQVVATITLRNRGATTASNIRIVHALLGGHHAVAIHVHHHLRLHQNRPRKFTVHFPNLTRGKNIVLQVSGHYLGGTFEESLRVEIP